MAVRKTWNTDNHTRGAKLREYQKRDYDDYVNDSWAFLISFFRWYPDIMGDIFRSPEAQYTTFELIQRVLIRAFERYQLVDITGCRSLTKTTCKIFQKLAHNMLWPGVKSSYYGPSYKQQAELAQTAFAEMTRDYPAIAKHYMINAESKDAWDIQTPYGSRITINAIRGKNIHDVTAEEYAQEETPRFDFEEYTAVVLYAVRLIYRVNGEEDPNFIQFQQHSITSASSKLNHAYTTRCKHLETMRDKDSDETAFVMDVPWQVVVLSQMRSYKWAMQRKAESTIDKWLREMESRYVGTTENAIVRDEVLAESRCLLAMEEHHCCKDVSNRLSPKEVLYVVGYDVSYEDNKANAKCACVVLKCTKQTDPYKRDKYLKQVVWVDDWAPEDAMLQAKRLKEIWYRFCYEGSETYIALDGWQYGKAVVEALMQDLGDGLSPLCVYNHDEYATYELEGAIPVIYPIKAGGPGVTDPDAEIIRNAEMQFEHRNVQLLTADVNEGIEAYKRLHRIKDDFADRVIERPYKKTTELCAQIQNLKKVPSGAGISERRISLSVQRDSWSALKYAMRLVQRLERVYLVRRGKKSDWGKELDKYNHPGQSSAFANMGGLMRSRLLSSRVGGRHYE